MVRMAAKKNEYLKPRFVPLAHRGGAFLPSNLGIENTLKAFSNAVKLGFNYLETDIHATSDGHLIAFHDVDLARVTDFVGKPGALTLRRLKELRVGGREEIPTLDELFEAFPEANFNIDIKEPQCTRLLAEFIDRHAAHDRVCVGSFSGRQIRRFRRLQPSVTTSASVGAAALLAAGLVRTQGDVYQIPLSHRVGGLNVRLVTAKHIAAIHRAGKKVHVWTIDDESTMHRLIDWGVDGIVTDRPDVLKAVLRARGMWSTR